MLHGCDANCRSGFRSCYFFFQPADIVNQVLNFGRAAPIDIRVSSYDDEAAYAISAKLAQDLNGIPGIVDSHVYQVPDAPALAIDVDRARALEFGLGQQSLASKSRDLPEQQLAAIAQFLVGPQEER